MSYKYRGNINAENFFAGIHYLHLGHDSNDFFFRVMHYRASIISLFSSVENFLFETLIYNLSKKEDRNSIIIAKSLKGETDSFTSNDWTIVNRFRKSKISQKAKYLDSNFNRDICSILDKISKLRNNIVHHSIDNIETKYSDVTKEISDFPIKAGICIVEINNYLNTDLDWIKTAIQYHKDPNIEPWYFE